MVKQVEEPLFSCLDLQVLVKHILQKQVSIFGLKLEYLIDDIKWLRNLMSHYIPSLLEFLDREHVTRRDGDQRLIL